MNTELPQLTLLFRLGKQLCGLPLLQIRETMRPLQISTLSNAPDFISGISVIRGKSLPVVDLCKLLGIADCELSRFVTVKIGEREAAIAVGEVIGVKDLIEWHAEEMSPLLGDANSDLISKVGALDGDLLLLLKSGCLLSENIWNVIESAGAAEWAQKFPMGN